jgi:hypothetical protein
MYPPRSKAAVTSELSDDFNEDGEPCQRKKPAKEGREGISGPALNF